MSEKLLAATKRSACQYEKRRHKWDIAGERVRLFNFKFGILINSAIPFCGLSLEVT